MTGEIEFAIESLENLHSVTRNLASIDVADVAGSSPLLNKIGKVFDSIPLEAKALKQYSSVIGIYKAKLTLVKACAEDCFWACYQISRGRIDVDFGSISAETLWESCVLLGQDKLRIGDMVKKLRSMIIDEFIAPKNVLTVGIETTESSWSCVQRSDPSAVSETVRVPEIIKSLLSFIKEKLPEKGNLRSEFGTRFWSQVAVIISTRFGAAEEFASLEQWLVDDQIASLETRRPLTEQWQQHKEKESKKLVNSVLSEVRQRLSADVNKKTMHLSIPKRDRLKNAIIPEVVSCEIVRIASTYLSKPDPDLVPAIVGLFTILRQPDLTDPNSIDIRSCAIFFSDCVYLSLALAVSEKFDFESQIFLLRAAGSRAISYFLKNVSKRASARLTQIAGGLVDLKQVASADQAIQDCLAEVHACQKEWGSLRIDQSLLAIWTPMLIDPVLKEMIRVSVLNAKTALGLSRGSIMYSTSHTNSGVWSLVRNFNSQAEKLPAITNLVSWNVLERVKLALCASKPDILQLQPLPNDESFYGLNNAGFEALLACNPLLHGESKESIKILAQRLMSDSNDESMSPKRGEQGLDKRDFASLFSRN